MTEATAPAGSLTGASLVAGFSSDARLARRAAAGDERAFAAIFERYHRDLYRYCLAILANPEDAQDALQNTMVKALRALPGDSRRVELKPWLYRVAHNEAIDLIRRRRGTEPLDTEHALAGPDLEREAEARERLAQLIADFQILPERQRGALVMRELSGLDFDQIGSVLGTSAAVARQTVYEARLSLRQIEAGREMSCDAVTKALSDGDGRVLRRRDIRAHLRACPECRAFRAEISGRRHDLAALSPLPAVTVAGLLQGVLGGSGGAGAGGLGTGLASGAAKGIAGSTVLKATATVAVVAAIGGATADRAHLVDLGLPGDSGSTTTRSEGAPPAATSASDRAATTGAGAASGLDAAGGGDKAGVARATPLGTTDARDSTPTNTQGTREALPASTAKGQQTAAANGNKDKTKVNGSARAREARVTRGPKASHPTHPVHPLKPAHPPHPAKPSPPDHAAGKGSAQKPASPSEANGASKAETAPESGGKGAEKDNTG